MNPSKVNGFPPCVTSTSYVSAVAEPGRVHWISEGVEACTAQSAELMATVASEANPKPAMVSTIPPVRFKLVIFNHAQ